jgi:hypothetical protein
MLDELYLESSDGFCDAERVLNAMPVYIAGSMAGDSARTVTVFKVPGRQRVLFDYFKFYSSAVGKVFNLDGQLPAKAHAFPGV